MWLSTHLRRHSPRGMVNNTFPLSRSDHGLLNSESLPPARPARPALTFLSKISSSSLVDVGAAGIGMDTPFGDISKESWVIVTAAHSGRCARCPASQIMVPDLSCGFQLNLSSGTRSRVL